MWLNNLRMNDVFHSLKMHTMSSMWIHKIVISYFDYVKPLYRCMFFSFISLLYLRSKLMEGFSQWLNWTAGISETRSFLKMDLNLESEQSLDLDLQYSESQEMFSALSLTQWDPFCISFLLFWENNIWWILFGFFFNVWSCLKICL